VFLGKFLAVPVNLAPAEGVLVKLENSYSNESYNKLKVRPSSWIAGLLELHAFTNIHSHCSHWMTSSDNYKHFSMQI